MDGTVNGNGQSQHQTRTICNALWRHNLSFHPYSQGDSPVMFSVLLPDKRSLVETYQQASLDAACYEVCVLLLATNSAQSLEALLEDGSVSIHRTFRPDGVTLAHLACALAMPDAVQVIQRKCGTNSNGLWTKKDVEDHMAVDVCFSQDMRKNLPRPGLFRSNKVHAQLPLTAKDKDKIFQMASQPDSFYKLIVRLQTFAFDVNSERSKDGDLLVHVAVKGDLPSLPFLCALVNTFRADPTLQDGCGLTPLCLAAQLGLETMAEFLVCVMGADVNATDGSEVRWTPLHHAVQHNHPRVVSMLLRRGADAGREDKNRSIPAHVARRNRLYECRQILHQHHQERVELLGKQAAEGSIEVDRLYPSDVWEVTREGYTLLMLAAMHNRVELVRDLVNMPNCPLDYRQMKTSNSGLVDSMSLSGSMGQNAATATQKTVEDTDFSLKTACHFAAERGHACCLRIMLDAGAHPSLPDASAWFPLHHAVDTGHLDCVTTILGFSNINLALCGLKSSIDMATQNSFEEIVSVLRDADERRQREVVTPFLFEVARSGNKDLLFQILENGDNVNPINESSDWPLLLAAGFGYLDIVTQLYQFGGLVTEHHRISHATTLHVAARGGHADVVSWLLQFCRPRSIPGQEEEQLLDINERNRAGASPLELAASQGHSPVVRLLLDHGASTTLPDSNGQLIKCAAFAGTQFLIETHRKKRLDNIIRAFQAGVPLTGFQKIWQGPSEFNLTKQNGDTIMMVAAQHAPAEVLTFLIYSAKTCQPELLLSPSGQPPPPQHHSSHAPSSPEDSDRFSEHSLPGALPSQEPTNGRHSSEEDWPATALPAGFRNRRTVGAVKRQSILRERQQRLFGNGGWRSDERTRPLGPVSKWKNRKTSSSNVESSDNEEEANGHAARNGDCTAATTGVLTRIIRQANPHDGHTALHRAALAGRHDNISVLLRADPECANLVDKEGNTALHLACRKQHKSAIKALLSCEHVDSSLRNQKLEYPEESCVKTGLRKMICKHRAQLQRKFGNLPSPPASIDKRAPISVTAASVASNPVYQSQLMGLPSVSGPLHNGSPSSTASDLTFSAFSRRMEELKLRLKKQDEDDTSESDSDKLP